MSRLAEQIKRLQAGKPFLVNVNDYGGYPAGIKGVITFCGQTCKVLDGQDSYVVLKRVKDAK